MLKRIFSWFTRHQRIKDLAVHVQALVYQVTQSPNVPVKPQGDTQAILQTTSSLLETFLEQRKALPAQAVPPAAETVAPQAAEPSTLLAAEQTAVLAPSVTELIKLSDWVLLAKTAATVVQPEVLEEIYRQLTEVLEQAGVALLDVQGACDYERQMVVGTQPTDDPMLNDHIYRTVRPGYIFHEQLIRPQEVIVYANDATS